MHLLLTLVLTAAPTGNAAELCDKLWDDTVAAAAPDLDPSDELRKSYLAREKAQLVQRCRASGPEVAGCPAQATHTCSARFPQPTDGGRALGLATCVYPEVQRCAQEAFLQASQAAVEGLLAELEAGKVAPEKGGLVKLTGPRMLLSLKGEALAERHGGGFWLLLVTRRAGSHIDGVVVRTAKSDLFPADGGLELAGLRTWMLRKLAGLGPAVSTDRPVP